MTWFMWVVIVAGAIHGACKAYWEILKKRHK